MLSVAESLGMLYCVVFALAVGQACLLTCLAMIAARHWGFLDLPDNHRKLHAQATPLMGGLAVYLTLVLGTAECLLFKDLGLGGDKTALQYVLMLLLSAGLLCALGLWDDKFGMRARHKFLLQSMAILPFVWWGRATTEIDVLGWNLELAWLGVPFTLLWLVACTNFVNLVDGLDGLASTVALIVSLAVVTLAVLTATPTILCVSTILSGALIGFLLFNWPPAKIFLGDSGSLPIGFLIGALSIEASLKKAAGLTLAVPLVLLSIPMFDTSMAILRRKLNGRKIGQGDRAHIHHCLRDRGLTPTQTLLAISGMCLATAAGVVLATIFRNDWVAVVICVGLLTLLIGGRVFGFNEFSLLVRHLAVLGSLVAALPAGLRAKLLLARFSGEVLERRLELWNQIVASVGRFGGFALHFSCQDLQTRRRLFHLSWSAPDDIQRDAELWELRFSCQRADGSQATILLEGSSSWQASQNSLNGCLELLVAFCENCPADEARDASEPLIRAVPVLTTPRVQIMPRAIRPDEQDDGRFDKTAA